MKLSVESAGGVASRVRVGNFELVFDQPESVPGGADQGPSPLDVMAASVGGCAHYFAAAFLSARQRSTAGLRVEVEADKTLEPSPRLGRIALRVELPPGTSPEHVAAVERAVKKCPAYGTLVHGPLVELRVEARPSTEAA